MNPETNVGTVATVAGLGTFPTLVFALVVLALITMSILNFKVFGQPGEGLMWLSGASIAVYLYLAASRMDSVPATVIILMLALLLFVVGVLKRRRPGVAAKLLLRAADKVRARQAAASDSAPAAK